MGRQKYIFAATKSAMKNEASSLLFTKAKTLFPGGVNSPVRAFRSVGGTPLFIESGSGAKIKDADGNEYIDFCCSWGPLILGHANKEIIEAIHETVKKGTSFGAPTALENQLGELILNNNPFIDKIRFVSSGTEAVMSAIRLARGFTGKNKIIKFEGCYHGHSDALLVKAGSGLVTFGNSSSAGVPESVVKDTLVIPLDSEQAVDLAIAEAGNDLAAIIIEPIPANNGLLLQRKEFLEYLRKKCDESGSLLIFDEVISGFRTSFSGAAGTYEIKADISTYGKIIGGGLPVGAYGARAPIMDSISPVGPVYQAGTLSGNPVAMAAGIAQLSTLLKPGFYESLEDKCKFFIGEIKRNLGEISGVKIFSIGSIFWIAFSDRDHIRKASEIDPESMNKFKLFYHELLKNGVYLGPSGYEVGFVSAAHSEELLRTAAEKISKCLKSALA